MSALAALMLLLSCTASAAAAFASTDEEADQVFDIIEARLELMRAVAAWKHAHQLPISDASREQQVLDATVAEAARLGIEPAAARELFALQIRLARQVQQHYFAAWQKGAPDAEPLRDLSEELRPELDDLGARLLRAIYSRYRSCSNRTSPRVTRRLSTCSALPASPLLMRLSS